MRLQAVTTATGTGVVSKMKGAQRAKSELDYKMTMKLSSVR